MSTGWMIVSIVLVVGPGTLALLIPPRSRSSCEGSSRRWHFGTVASLVRRRDASRECRLANRRMAQMRWPWHEDWSWEER